MHIMKVKLAGGHYTRLRAEACRQADHYENNVDLERSGDNIVLQEYLEADAEKLKAEIKARGVNREIRPDAVAALDCVCTLPKDEPISKDDREAIKAWGNDVLEGFLEAYGLERGDVLGAVIHMDETYPHVHISVLPISRDEKGAHLSAKKVNNRSALNKLHDSVAEHMKERGYKGTYVSEDKEARGKGTATLEAYKEHQEAIKERDKAIKERDEARLDAEDYQDSALMWERKASEEALKAHEWTQKALDAKMEMDMNVKSAQNSLAFRRDIESATKRMKRVSDMVAYTMQNANVIKTAPEIEAFYKEIEGRFEKWMDTLTDKNGFNIGQSFRNMEADQRKHRDEDYER